MFLRIEADDKGRNIDDLLANSVLLSENEERVAFMTYRMCLCLIKTRAW